MLAQEIVSIIERLRSIHIEQGQLLERLAELEQEQANKSSSSAVAPAWASLTNTDSEGSDNTLPTVPVETALQSVPAEVPSAPVAECQRQPAQDRIITRVVQQVPYTGDFKIGNKVRITNRIDKKSGPVTAKDRTGVIVRITLYRVHIRNQFGEVLQRDPKNIELIERPKYGGQR